MGYSPEVLALSLSWQCNIQCGHCIVEAEPRKTESLERLTIDSVFNQLRQNGIQAVLIYGGEPFLRQNDLLPYTIKKAFDQGYDVSIGTNGFWGRSPEQALMILNQLEELSEQNDKYIEIGLSVDQFHRSSISPEAIANIIAQHKKNEFNHLSLGIQTFRDDDSFKVLDEVEYELKKQGVHWLESNDGWFLYPALSEELIELKEENYQLITNMLGPEGYVSEEAILVSLRSALDIFSRSGDVKVICRQFDIGGGNKYYTIFPDPRSLMQLIIEKRVIKAGRAKSGIGDSELSLGNDRARDHLVVGPGNLAYAYPAQVSLGDGISMNGKELSEVIYEVGQKLNK